MLCSDRDIPSDVAMYLLLRSASAKFAKVKSEISSCIDEIMALFSSLRGSVKEHGNG